MLYLTSSSSLPLSSLSPVVGNKVVNTGGAGWKTIPLQNSIWAYNELIPDWNCKSQLTRKITSFSFIFLTDKLKQWGARSSSLIFHLTKFKICTLCCENSMNHLDFHVQLWHFIHFIFKLSLLTFLSSLAHCQSLVLKAENNFVSFCQQRLSVQNSSS